MHILSRYCTRCFLKAQTWLLFYSCGSAERGLAIDCLMKSFDVAVMLLGAGGGHTDDGISAEIFAGSITHCFKLRALALLASTARVHSLTLINQAAICYGKYFVPL